MCREVGRQQQKASNSRKEGREFRRRHRPRRRIFASGGAAFDGHDAGIQKPLVLEMDSGGDEELGELAGAVRSRLDRGDKTGPEGFACGPKARQGARRGAGEGVVDGAAEAGPEISCLFSSCGGDGRWRGESQNLDEFGLGVVRKFEMSHCCGAEGEGRGVGDDEDCRQARYLRERPLVLAFGLSSQ